MPWLWRWQKQGAHNMLSMSSNYFIGGKLFDTNLRLGVFGEYSSGSHVTEEAVSHPMGRDRGKAAT
jgi:hypothetical protein